MFAETAYLFRHAVVRDAAYGLQPPSERALLHGLALDILEALPGLGRKRAIRLFRARPMEGRDDLRKALDDPEVADGVLPFLIFDRPEH